MPNAYLFLLLFTCLFLACGAETEQQRTAQIHAMQKCFVNELQQKNNRNVRNLVQKVAMEGNSPEGLQNLKRAQELHEKTLKTLQNNDFLAYQTQWQASTQDIWEFLEAEKRQEIKKQIENTTYQPLKILQMESIFLRFLGAWDFTREHSSWHNPIRVFVSTPNIFEYDTVTYISYLDSFNRTYRLDSLFIDDVLQEHRSYDGENTLKLPSLKAGKHTLRFKLVYSHNATEKDTTIFATHTFDVLPK